MDSACPLPGTSAAAFPRPRWGPKRPYPAQRLSVGHARRSKTSAPGRAFDESVDAHPRPEAAGHFGLEGRNGRASRAEPGHARRSKTSATSTNKPRPKAGSFDGGGGGSRTRVQSHSVSASTCLSSGYLPSPNPEARPAMGGWRFLWLFFVPSAHATGAIGTSQVLTRPDLEPWHCQTGRRPRRASDYSLRCGHREVLIVVGTCGVFPVFSEVPSTSACSLDLPRPCRNRFAPSTCETRVAVRGRA